jgi:hypothetical protein
MRNDLLGKRDLKLYSKNSILNLLGKPDSDVNNEYHYYLGSTGRGINTVTLRIKFEGEFVIEVKVYEG